MSGKKRLRIFAGPNGSGKSTITEKIRGLVKLGVYVNADQIKICVEQTGRLNFTEYELQLNYPDLIRFISHHSLFTKCSIRCLETALNADCNSLLFTDRKATGGYMVLIISEYIRLRLLEQSDRFTFETVLSDESKLEFMRMAKDAGFKVYLYYVALASPEMNVARVHSRVLQGGHDVPKRKIVQRYERTMSNLFEAMRIADNVYLFDNSYQDPVLIAQKENGILQSNKEYMPQWYKTYVLDKLPKTE